MFCWEITKVRSRNNVQSIVNRRQTILITGAELEMYMIRLHARVLLFVTDKNLKKNGSMILLSIIIIFFEIMMNSD